MYLVLTLLHYCTFVSFVAELSCALDHSSNAFALAQGCHKTGLNLSGFHSLSVSLRLFVSANAHPDDLNMCVVVFLRFFGAMLFVVCVCRDLAEGRRE